MDDLSPEEKKFRRNLSKRLEAIEKKLEEVNLLRVEVLQLREIVKEALNEP
jgi:tetrahydromethanopterin S-methyltransferase subunit G